MMTIHSNDIRITDHYFFYSNGSHLDTSWTIYVHFMI